MIKIKERNLLESFLHKIPSYLRMKKYGYKNHPLEDVPLANELLCALDEPFYNKYKYSKRQIESHRNCTKGRIIETIQSYIQNTIKENRNIGTSEIIEKVRPDLATLPKTERDDTMRLISIIAEKFNTVRKYLDFKNGPYKTPKELLCAIRGITSNELIGNITVDINVIQYGIGFMFFVGDEKSYNILYNGALEDSGEGGDGFSYDGSPIYGLKKTLVVIKKSYADSLIQHEGQHNRNHYFMPDKDYDLIARAKDEITAYLRDGRSIYKADKWGGSIKDILTKTKSEGGLYQYGLEGKKWETHKAQVRELLSYADELIQLTECPIIGLKREIVISILSYTPYRKRKELHTNIIGAIDAFLLNELGTTGKSLEEKKNMLNEIYKKLNYTSGDVNNEIIIDESILNGFRRTGIANKETEMDVINKAKSIDEIKYILKDPKYSHISRGPNNKGGIEISAMIDEVIAGYLPITFLPPEIREIIEMFIEK